MDIITRAPVKDRVRVCADAAALDSLDIRAAGGCRVLGGSPVAASRVTRSLSSE